MSRRAIISRTFRAAQQEAYSGRNDQPKQTTMTSKGTTVAAYMRYRRQSANIYCSASIRLAKLRRQQRRFVEYSAWRSHQQPRDTTCAFFNKLRGDLQQLGCPHLLHQNRNNNRVLEWIQQEIQTVEAQQTTARLTAWRRKLRDLAMAWKSHGQLLWTTSRALRAASSMDTNSSTAHTSIGKPFGLNPHTKNLATKHSLRNSSLGLTFHHLTSLLSNLTKYGKRPDVALAIVATIYNQIENGQP